MLGLCDLRVDRGCQSLVTAVSYDQIQFRSLVSVHNEVSSLLRQLRGDVRVFFGHPDLRPLGSHGFAVSADPSCETDGARCFDPDSQMPAVSEFLPQDDPR